MYKLDMVKKIAISEVRQNLSGLLRRLERTPDLKILITRDGKPVAQLTVPPQLGPRVSAGQALLGLAALVGAPDAVRAAGDESIAEQHDHYLYSRE